jgi:hypothetical protein
MIKAFLISLMLLMSFPAPNVSAQGHPTKRCIATTKKGTRCKNKAVKGSKFCQFHKKKRLNSQVKRCKAITKTTGKQCSRAVKKNGYCTQHYKMYMEGRL